MGFQRSFQARHMSLLGANTVTPRSKRESVFLAPARIVELIFPRLLLLPLSLRQAVYTSYTLKKF